MKHVERILLINVGSDKDVSSISNDGTFPALGVISLATVLVRDHPDIEVIAIDGQITPIKRIEEIIYDFTPDVVGLSVLGVSYLNSLHLAQVAKNVGAVVVFGNDHAAILGHQILKRRQEVDYVCIADIGEFAFSALVDCINGTLPIDAVPQILYRSREGIKHNQLPEMPVSSSSVHRGLASYILDAIPIPNRKLMPQENWNTYLANYLARYGKFHDNESITGVTTMNRARGCARVKAPCTFCGIADLSVRFSSPAVFWEDVKAAQTDLSASIFYEAFDSMSSSPRWIEQLVAARPKDIGEPKFFVYTQAAETTPRLLRLYKELGVYRVNIGLEAGDTRMLKSLKGPNDSLEKNQRACMLFKDAGIPIYGSLVLGGPGETYESLEHTIAFAKWLIDNEMMAALQVQPLYPDLGATTGRWLMNPHLAREAAQRKGFEILDDSLLDSMPAKYGDEDMINFDEISMEWCKIFSHVPWGGLLKAIATIRAYADAHDIASSSARISQTQFERGALHDNTPHTISS